MKAAPHLGFIAGEERETFPKFGGKPRIGEEAVRLRPIAENLRGFALAAEAGGDAAVV